MKKIYKIEGVSKGQNWTKFDEKIAETDQEKDSAINEMCRWHDLVTITEFEQVAKIQVKP